MQLKRRWQAEGGTKRKCGNGEKGGNGEGGDDGGEGGNDGKEGGNDGGEGGNDGRRGANEYQFSEQRNSLKAGNWWKKPKNAP